MSVPNDAPLVVGDRAFCRNWSANRWTLVEILEVHGSRFRVKHPVGHPDGQHIFSAHRSALLKAPAHEEAEPGAGV